MIYLKKLSIDDGVEIYNMLQEIKADDNGFHNKVFGVGYDEYQKWLEKEFAFDNGELEDWMVPQSSFWMYDGDEPVGYGRIRHCLNDNLSKTSGHIGYAIRSSRRGVGYGNKILELLLDECKKLEIDRVQISANKDNLPSNRIILRSGGILFRECDGKNSYYIENH